jgi:hypothetical protein
MRKGLSGTIVVAFAVACAGFPALATDINGFLKPKGHADLAVSFTQESYDSFWAGETEVAPPEVVEVETRTASLWVGYGVTEKLTLFGTLAYVDANSDGTMGFAESDLQDVTALIAYGFWGRDGSVSHDLIAATGVRTPLVHYEANQPVDVGDGTTDVLLRLVYLLRVRGFYWSQQVGFDARNEDAPDGVPIYTELGYTRGRVTYNAFYSRLVVSDGSDIGDPDFTFPGNREEYERVGAKIYCRTGERIGFAVSYFDTLDGRNTGNSSGASLSAVFSF